MITRVRFQNFKALHDVQVDFTAPLTVFVGPNACGKTSVLQGVSLLSQFARPGKYTNRHVPWDLRTQRATKDGEALALAISLVNQGRAISVAISEIGEGVDDIILSPAEQNLPEKGPGFDMLPGEQLSSCGLTPTGLLRLDPAVLAKPSHAGDQAPALGDDGAGLASVLAETATADPARFAQIQDALRAVIPAVKQVRLLRTPVEYSVKTHDPAGGPMRERRTGQGHKIHFDFQGADKVPAEQASEGTLLVLGWLTALLGEGGRRLLLIDDLDRGLHPKAQGELIAILRRLLAQDPKLQILATSHSPYLLDKLKPEEIRLMTLDDGGAAICGSLSDHPDYARWKDLMLPGEAWSTLGEDWLKARAPKTDA